MADGILADEADLIERMAAAMAVTDGDTGWNSLGDLAKEIWRKYARAALDVVKASDIGLGPGE